jgi:uncharacterized SAM-binding protein YcdF (DUF218 family)
MATTQDISMSSEGGRFRWLRLTWRAITLAVIGSLGAFVIGFFVFLSSVSRYGSETAASAADAIVVLTGGHARIEAAVKLLEEKKGGRLLISGVHPSTSRDVLRETYANDDALFRCCVDVDRLALDTIGNAEETAHWATDHGYKSLIVVTNDYHMPRSLLEMRQHIGEVEIIPHAVVAGTRDSDDPVVLADRYRVLFGEYLKYSAAQARAAISSGADGVGTRNASLTPGS